MYMIGTRNPLICVFSLFGVYLMPISALCFIGEKIQDFKPKLTSQKEMNAGKLEKENIDEKTKRERVQYANIGSL